MTVRLERVEDPADPSSHYTRMVDLKKSIVMAREQPWLGQLSPLDHDEGPAVAAMKANAGFNIAYSSMLTVPGVVYNDLSEMTEQHFKNLMKVQTLGLFLCRDDTLQIIGWRGHREIELAPRHCLEHFWKLCSENNFRVEAGGMMRDGQILTLFARHTGPPFEVKGNRFIRYAYFMSAFGIGQAPMLVHAAYHTISGKMLVVDTQRIGLARVRGFQVVRKTVQGPEHTMAKLKMTRWDEDWKTFCGVIEEMADVFATPLMAERIFTLALPLKFGNRALLKLVSEDVAKYRETLPNFKIHMARIVNAWNQSYISATPGTMNTILGALLFACQHIFRSTSGLQLAGSACAEWVSSGICRRRSLFDEARKVLYAHKHSR
jgi:hypothetical protein